MKAKKLPSGSWRVQFRLNGERISVTAESEDEAIYQAMALKTKREKTVSATKKEKTVFICVKGETRFFLLLM